jgi:hypothetical protein
MKIKVIKKYLVLSTLSLISLLVFIYLESHSNQFSIKLNKHSALSTRSIHILNSLTQDKSVQFEIYTNKDSVIAKKINKFFIPYKRINNAIAISFIDPVTNPSKLKLNTITMQGEILLKFADSNKLKQINITELSESAIMNGIINLLNDKDEWVVFAEGYGMRSVEQETDEGLLKLLVSLKKTGMHIARMPLNASLELPENVKLIILPEPSKVLDTEVVKWLSKQSQQGKSIWWLNDVSSNQQMDLELALDVMLGEKQIITADKYSTTIVDFPKHAITENFNQPIFIAEAREIMAAHSKALIVTETNSTIAITKQLVNSRLVITGDTDFISNAYLGVAANKSFGIRIVDWLLYHDDRMNIPLHINQHTQLFLSQNQLLFLSIFFLFIIPLIYLIIVFKQWRAKRVNT